MKLIEGDLVSITGGSHQGARGYIFATSKQTVWIQLAEGRDKDKVIQKRKKTWLRKLSADDDGDNKDSNKILDHHQSTLSATGTKNRSNFNTDVLVAMPKGHSLDKDDVKTVFASLPGKYNATQALILPTSRNCLVHFDSFATVQSLLAEHKVVMIEGRAARIGLYHYSSRNAPTTFAEETPATALQQQEQNTSSLTTKRPLPTNSRAEALFQAKTPGRNPHKKQRRPAQN